MPCDNPLFVRTNEEGLHEFVCLGHHKTYHGDPARDHFFWKHHHDSVDVHHLPPWDTIDHAHLVCSHHEEETPGHAYRCKGHSAGDYRLPTFHGDPSRGHKFWVYPHHREIVNP